MKNIYVGNIPLIEQGGGNTFNINTKLKNALTLDSLFDNLPVKDIGKTINNLADNGKIFYARGLVKLDSVVRGNTNVEAKGNYFVDAYVSVANLCGDSSTTGDKEYSASPCVMFYQGTSSGSGSIYLPGVGYNAKYLSGPLYSPKVIGYDDNRDEIYALQKSTEREPLDPYGSSGVYIMSTAGLQIWYGDVPD